MNRSIAIVGATVRLPLADSMRVFWANLERQLDCIRRCDLQNRGNGSERFWGGFLDDTEMFDANYFNISEEEAALTDPMQRLFLEVCADLLDTSGHCSMVWGKRVGVFVGAPSNYGGGDEQINALHATRAMLANRVSQFFNFTGPSMMLDSVCSSALAALHMACESIVSGDCEMAIAGGANLVTLQHLERIERMQLLSPDHKCKTFDAGANGFVLGEGVGAFLLKPLEEALEKRDLIWGVIRSSITNHNGLTENPMLPDAYSISQLLETAWQSAKIDPESISYIETNGTGTPFGDAIEVQGLSNAFGRYTDKKNFCGLGAIKTNIGNLEAASGVGGVAKVLVAMKHRQIPANLHFCSTNPLIKLEKSPFYICSKPHYWESDTFPRRAGINALGIGGSNAHVIIEEPPETEQKTTVSISKIPARPGPELLCLSAKSLPALSELCRCYLDFIEDNRCSLADLCTTHNAGRMHFEHRIAIMAVDRRELMQKLTKISQSDERGWADLQGVYYSKWNPSLNSPAKKNFFATFLKSYRREKRKPEERGRIIFSFSGNCQKERETERAVFLEQRGVKPEKTIDFDIDAITRLAKEKYTVFVLLGTEENSTYPKGDILCFPCPGQIERENVLTSFCARIYAAGGQIDFNTFYNGRAASKVTLPPYPYQKKICQHPAAETRESTKPTNTTATEDFSSPVKNVEKAICDALRSVTRIDELDIDKDLSEYGLDSASIIELSRVLSEKAGIAVYPLDFVKCPTIRKLSLQIEKNTGAGGRKNLVFEELAGEVTLEPATKEHYFEVCGWFDDDEINRWLDPFFQENFTIREYVFFLRKKDKRTFLIRHCQNSVGIGGLVNIDHANASADAWIVIGDRKTRARGISILAGIELCRKSFWELGLRTLTAKIQSKNQPSLAMAQYGNWRRVGTLTKWTRSGNRYCDSHLYQLLADDFISWLEEMNLEGPMEKRLREIEEKLICYVKGEFQVEEENFDAASDLFEEGYIESIHLEVFFSFIEKEYGIEIDENFFLDERVSTIQGIARMIMEKKDDDKHAGSERRPGIHAEERQVVTSKHCGGQAMFARMAWRNVWRNKRRSLITLAVMSFSCMFLLMLISMSRGSHSEMITNSVKAGSGHIQIHKRGFFSLFTPKYYLEMTPELADAVKQDVVKSYALRVKGQGLVAYGARSQSVTVMGIQPGPEKNISVFYKKKSEDRKGPLVEGEYLREDDWREGYPLDESGRKDPTKPFRYPGLLIGQKLREKFHIKVGSGVVVTIQSLTGEIKRHKFEIRGIFKTLDPKYDKGTVLIHYKTAQNFFDYGVTSDFHSSDFTSIKALASRLANSKTLLGKYLRGKLRESTIEMLRSNFDSVSEDLKESLLKDISALLEDRTMYRPEIFPKLSPKLEKLKAAAKNREALRIFNHRLLEESLPEIKVRPKGGYFSEVVILTGSNDEVDETAAILRKKLDNENYEVLTWTEMNPNLEEFILLDAFMGYLNIGMLFVITAIGIMITLLMAIFERVREFGIMRAMGMKPSRIVSLILMESFWLGLLSCVIGAVLASPILYYLQTHGIDMAMMMGGEEGAPLWAFSIDTLVHAKVETIPLLFCFSFVLLFTLLVSLYPAFHAARIKVLDAITFV